MSLEDEVGGVGEVMIVVFDVFDLPMVVLVVDDVEEGGMDKYELCM